MVQEVQLFNKETRDSKAIKKSYTLHSMTVETEN